MSDVTHILVPTDGSETSVKAAEFAGNLARALDARVTALIVMDSRAIVAEAWNSLEKDAVESVRRNMEDHATREELPASVDAIGDVSAGVEVFCLWGNPAEEICKYADENGVDLIVMGSHGRGAIRRAFLGSVSYGVVHGAPCAVTIVR